MNQISVYFEKFKHIGLGDQIVKKSLIESIVEVIGESCREDLNVEKISLGKNSIKIKISGPLKNEIYLNKVKIQEKFNIFQESSKDII